MSKDQKRITELEKRNKELEQGLHNIIAHYKAMSPTMYKRAAACYIAIKLVGDSDG